jgi:hypothetical protein
MVFIARAAAPTLPAWLVFIRMKRVFMGGFKNRGKLRFKSGKLTMIKPHTSKR